MQVPMNVQQPIVGVLLAAGTGTRFGGGKLIHPLEDGVAMAVHAARNLLAAGLEVIAVVRSGDFALGDLLEEEGCHVTHSTEAARGMGHTLAHGVACAREASGWIVALGDMPRIQPATITQIVGALHAGAMIAAPVYRGERGHPVGFQSALRAELLALSGDRGAQPVVQKHRDELRLIECDDPGVVLDIDLKTDLGRVS